MSQLCRFSNSPALFANLRLVGLVSVLGQLSATSPVAADGPVAYFPFNGGTEDVS